MITRFIRNSAFSHTEIGTVAEWKDADVADPSSTPSNLPATDLPPFEWWTFVTDLLLPFAAILVPTIIAILLFRSERRAAAEQRRTEMQEKRRERVIEGIRGAERMMNHLVAAGYEDDFREAARTRFRAVNELGTVKINLGTENNAVWKWIVEEVGIVAGGLEDRETVTNLPVHLEQIVHRGARYSNAIVDWLTGEIDNAWFEDATHLPLADTPPLAQDDDPRQGR